MIETLEYVQRIAKIEICDESHISFVILYDVQAPLKSKSLRSMVESLVGGANMTFSGRIRFLLLTL